MKPYMYSSKECNLNKHYQADDYGKEVFKSFNFNCLIYEEDLKIRKEMCLNTTVNLIKHSKRNAT